MLYSHFTQNCIFLYFLEAKNPCFVTKNCWKSSYICVFILSKKRRNWFHKNLHNSGMVGRRKLPDPSLNRIFNALSIGVQYTLSFQWTNFGLKCLLEDVFSFEDITARRLHEDFLKTSSRRLEEDVLKSWRRLWKTYCKHVLRTSWKTKMFAWEKQATIKSSMPVVSPPTKD